MTARAARGGPDLSGTPTKSDIRNQRAQASKADQARADAYEAGRTDAGEGQARGYRAPLEADMEPYYNQGFDEAAPAKTPSGKGNPSPAPTGSGPGPGGSPSSSATPAWSQNVFNRSSSSGSKADSAAGFVLGMIAYAVGINFLRGGPAAVRGWFAAKFINKPYTGAIQASGYQVPVSPSTPPVPANPVGPPVGVPSVFGAGG